MTREDIIRMAKECGNWSGQTVEMNDVGLERFAKLIRAAIEQAQEPETELETYKRLYALRGKALERPCINCGHQPAKVKTMAQPEPAPGYCKRCKQYSIEEPLHSQPEQKLVAWMHPSWINPDTRGWSNDSFSAIPIEGWVPVYTAPRQWQGLTEAEKVNVAIDCGCADVAWMDFADAIEAKLKEKNT